MPDTTSDALRHDLVGRLRAGGHLRDDRVAGAFAAVPRELFVAEHVDRHGLADAYRDEVIVTRRDPATGVPTSSSSQPAIMAQMLEMLGLRPGHRVLEIGAGTGYNAALLAHLVGERGTVTSVEIDADVAVAARRALVSAQVPVRVELGDGARGWPAAAPVDAVISTASTESVPRAWFDQLRPGGRLVVPVRLSPVLFWLQAVVAFRKVRHGFDQVAITGGGFMALRPIASYDHDRARPAPARLAAGEVADGGGDRLLVEITGPALAGLGRTGRQQLLMTALGFSRRRRIPLGRSSPYPLLAHVALGLPEERLVEVRRPAGGSLPARGGDLGVVDAVDGSLAVLSPLPSGGAQLDAYGGRGAERALLAAIGRWARAGRPRLSDATVTVRYGSVRPHAWRSARRGDQWVALDWRSPARV